VHFEEGIVLNRDGKAPPEWEKGARKDVYRIGEGIDSSVDVEIAIRFREFAGTYMEHCHNTQHEDTSMLLRWDVEKAWPVPIDANAPAWLGRRYLRELCGAADLSHGRSRKQKPGRLSRQRCQQRRQTPDDKCPGQRQRP
jgi:hypothetical protein